MSWSYSGNPADSTLDKIRFLIGDTDTTDQLLNDEEITYLITESGGSIYQAAHDAAYAIASKFTRMASSTSVGDMSVSYSDRGSSYYILAKEMLLLGARREPPTPWISPQNILRAADKVIPPENGTEFYTGQTDYLR